VVDIKHELTWAERNETIHVIKQDLKTLGAVTSEDAVVPFVAKHGSLTKPFNSETMTLHRPSLAPIYGGPTLLEALWNEMDRLMEGLMTQADAEDGGDRYRAQELAWVIAIVTNAYNPSIDAVRAEAMRRWEAAEAEADAQERALDPDPDAHAEEQQHQWDAAGVNGYEL
jgi:hypothetical protein